MPQGRHAMGIGGHEAREHQAQLIDQRHHTLASWRGLVSASLLQ